KILESPPVRSPAASFPSPPFAPQKSITAVHSARESPKSKRRRGAKGRGGERRRPSGRGGGRRPSPSLTPRVLRSSAGMQNPGGHHASPASAAKSKSSTAAAASASGQGSSHHHHHHHSGGGGGGGGGADASATTLKRKRGVFQKDRTALFFLNFSTAAVLRIRCLCCIFPRSCSAAHDVRIWG
ncbi:Os01g0338100, partial [Oryza sativa Japonica Group]